MRKWTYLVASLLLAGATPMFTGCVDNDEPEGITILRGAKAELLKAQAAVEAARVAEVEANAALINAKAKLKEAQAANELAQAKINEAIAKQEEYKAQILATKDELKKAELERQLQVWENKQAEWEAEQQANAVAAEQAAKEWEIKYKKMQAKYEQVLVDLAEAKVTLVGKQQKALSSYTTALKNAKDDYDAKAETLRKAQRDLTDAIAAAENAPEYLKRELEWDVQAKKDAVVGHDAALTKAKEELEAAKQMQPSELSQKQEELENELLTLQEEMIDLQLEAAEKVREIDETDGRQQIEMSRALDETYFAERKIEEFTLQYGNDVPWSYVGGEVKLDETTYSLSEVETPYSNYQNRLAQLSGLLDQFESWQRDENDNMWTQDLIARMEAELEEYNKEVDEAVKAWRESVDAYKAGSSPVDYDASQISGYYELNSAINAYNEQAKLYNKAVDFIYENELKIKEARKAYKEAVKLAGEKHDADLATINTEYLADLAAAPAKYAALEADRSAKWTAYKEAYAKWQADDTKENHEAKDAAEDAWLAAKQASEDFYNVATGEYTQIEEAYDDKLDDLWNTYVEACNKAEEDRDAIVDASKAVINENETNKQDVILPALEAAVSNAVKALSTFKTNAGTGVVLANGADITRPAEGTWDNDKHDYIRPTLSFKDFINLDRDALHNVLISRSEVLFGDNYFNVYGDPSAYLLDLDKAKENIKAEVDKKAKEEELVGWDYIEASKEYGMIGEAMFIEKKIEIAEAWLTNNSAVKALYDQTKVAYDNLKNTAEADLETYKENREACDALAESIKEKKQETLAPVSAKIEELAPVQNLLTAVTNAIADYLKLGGDAYWENAASQDDIDYYISTLETKVAQCEKNLYDANTAVMKAEDRLANWNAGNLSVVELRRDQVEDAEAELAIAQENLEAARTALDNAIQTISVAGLTTDDTTSAGE